MRVNLQQIADGIVAFAESEVIPKMGEDKPAVILVSVGINALRANPKMLEGILNQGVMRTLLGAEEDGTYEMDGIFEAVGDSLRKYGAYPVRIPAIPLISPTDKTLKFDENDIKELKRCIERGG